MHFVNATMLCLADERDNNEPGEISQTAGASPHRWKGKTIFLNLILNQDFGYMNLFWLWFCFGVTQGTARRKKKVVHRTATADDKKLQFSLKKLGVNNISGIEEVHVSSHSSLLF